MTADERDRLPDLRPGRDLILVLCVLALASAAVLTAPGNDFPSLHTILDTSICLVSAVLALLLWDIGGRIRQPLPRLLALCFAAAALLQFLHTMTALQWTDNSEEVQRFAAQWRPGTWGPAAYLLPIGAGAALGWRRLDPRHGVWFALALLVLGGALVALFHTLPRYTAPGWLGITRPFLLLVPLLWVPIGIAYWRLRTQERVTAAIAMMGLILLLENIVMLYSQAPADSPAMIAHLGKLAGHLFLLLSLTQMGTWDMAQRIRAERDLKSANESLEARVRERTAELEQTNVALRTEMAIRAVAEQKTQMQLARLSLLQQITRAIGERQDLNSIFQVLVRSLEDQLPVDFACISLYDPVAQTLTVASVGVKSAPLALGLALPERARINIDQNGLARCVRGELVYEPDVSAVPFPFPRQIAGGGLRSLVVTPLGIESAVFGVLIAARREVGAFSSGDCEFLRQLSEHVALAAHQAQLYGALQQAYDDLRHTQQAVMQQERLRALGQMASGIAHDINNAISPIGLYTEAMLEQEPNLSAQGREQLKTIARAIDDVAATVSRMREFYRERGPQAQLLPVRLNDLVQQVIDLTRARWSDMPQQRGVVITVQQECLPELPAVMGIESELREALTNLIFNAVDALPTGGTITVRTSVLVDSAKQRQVELAVVDTGVGMDEATRARCLEPFFTTKGERGTGLGLPMVYGIVQRHGADLDLKSAPGQGTTVRLLFPPADACDSDGIRTDTIESVRAGLRILIVDDDPIILESLGTALRFDGHVITTASGGEAGIERMRAAINAGEPFDAVITDLGMPHVDGRQVARAVKSASPSTPVVLLTGWGQRLLSEGDLPAHVDRVLSKPPKMRDLRAALARVVPIPQHIFSET